jgi:nucleotide-binding universal stress UspA family protein
VNYQEVINIASKFDAKGFKQAETALGKLSGTAKKVAGSLGLAFGAAAIAQYGKAAVKAFADDEKAALRLNRAVENLGIGFANPAIADYIANLERSAAVADDILRPAFQGLLTTTGSLTQSQKLLNDAITISRASGVDLATVTEDLGKGYIGITKGLTKYNTGLTRAELQSKSFNEILGVILKRSAGAAEDYLDTTAYKFDVLSVASSNASEIIGGGLVDAFALIGGGTDASDAAYVIETIASALAKVTVQTGRTIGVIPTLIANLKKLPREIFSGFVGKQFGVNVNVAPKEKEVKLTLTQKRQQELLAKLEKDSLKRERERLALKNKQLATDKAKAIIAKGEAALLKGESVFDMDKIQIAAALTNQAEQLGKATSAAQFLQIANDTARLNVKKSILALEDAIASKDEAAIIAATNKLNADLKVLGALGLQNVKLQDIKSILESLKPKDLINQANLDAALAKIKEMLDLLTKMNADATKKTVVTGGGALSTVEQVAAVTAKLPASVSASDWFETLTEDEQAQLGGYMPFVGSMASNVPTETFSPSTAGYGYNGTGRQVPVGVSITVNTGIGDPNAIAEAIDQVIQDAVNRGTLRNGLNNVL